MEFGVLIPSAGNAVRLASGCKKDSRRWIKALSKPISWLVCSCLLYKLRELLAESPIAERADFTARLRGMLPMFRENFK